MSLPLICLEDRTVHNTDKTITRDSPIETMGSRMATIPTTEIMGTGHTSRDIAQEMDDKARTVAITTADRIRTKMASTDVKARRDIIPITEGTTTIDPRHQDPITDLIPQVIGKEMAIHKTEHLTIKTDKTLASSNKFHHQ